MDNNIFEYDKWNSGEPYEWMGCNRTSEWDTMDHHVDLGCGTIKKGRIGIDRFAAPGVNIVMDLDKLKVLQTTLSPNQDSYITPGEIEKHIGGVEGFPWWERNKDTVIRLRMGGLPFPDNSIKSIVSHHFFEHVGEGFVPLMDEIYRVLEPDGILRAITPLFPSRAAVEDADHKRYFMYDTWENFCGFPDNHWMESFSVPYSKARFECVNKDYTPDFPPEERAEKRWGPDDVRELRVALRARK